MVLPFKWDLVLVLSLGAIYSVYSSQFYESVYCFSATELQVPLEVILKFWKPIDFENSSRVLVVFGYLPKNQEPPAREKVQC